jgi:hypothetical protein
MWGLYLSPKKCCKVINYATALSIEGGILVINITIGMGFIMAMAQICGINNPYIQLVRLALYGTNK